MHSRSIAGLSAMTAFGLLLLSGNAFAQQKSLKDQLVGSWTLVSNVIVTKDGKRLDVFGTNPKEPIPLSSPAKR